MFTVLARIVQPALISNFGMMTRRLFKPSVHSRPGVYFMGENSIVSQNTNNKVIIQVISDSHISL